MKVLTTADRVSYFANVLAVCETDGHLSAEEVDVLKDVARRLSLTQEEATAARKLVARGRYEFAVLEDGKTRQDNMDDMVLAALADGMLDDRASGLIERFAKQLRYAQADIDMVTLRAQRKLDQIRSVRPAAAKATPARDGKAAPEKPAGAAVPAGRFTEARVPPPTVREPPRHPAPVVAAPVVSPAVASQPPEPPAGETAVASRQPEPATREAPVPALEVCQRCRALARDPNAYCFAADGALNVWGCRLLNQPWRAGAGWLAAGAFRPSGCFEFDREAIRAALAEGLAAAASCPHLNTAYVKRAIDALPSRAWLGRRWRYRRPRVGEKSVALRVRERHQGVALGLAQPVAGIEPTGNAEARRVIRDACRACGRAMPEL